MRKVSAVTETDKYGKNQIPNSMLHYVPETENDEEEELEKSVNVKIGTAFFRCYSLYRDDESSSWNYFIQ